MRQLTIDLLYLTERQAECLRWLSEGLTIAQTAAKMNVQRCTAQRHLEEIRWRLDAHNTTHAVAIAIRRGLI